MHIYAALLRGINVGGHNKLPMADLREICRSNGFHDAKTYIQSGNLVFRSADKAESISATLTDSIMERFGFRPDIVIRTAAELKAAAGAYPFDTSDHKKAHILFLDGKTEADSVKELMELECSPDQISVGETEIHCYFPNGVLESNIDFKKMERILGVAGTARNWRTVQKLIELVSELEP